MFSKLLGILNPKESEEALRLQEKIAKMDLSEMRLYVNGKLDNFEVTEFGLNEIITKLISKNENTSNFYIAENDMDSKRKKVLDLLILVLENKNISVLVLETAQEFLEVYEEMIKMYDHENQDIYDKRIKKKISLAVDKINAKSDITGVLEFT